MPRYALDFCKTHIIMRATSPAEAIAWTSRNARVPAERIIAELKSQPPKWTRKQIDAWFLDLTEGMQLRRPKERPGITLWDGLVNGKRITLFEQNTKSDIVWCERWLVWAILEKHFSTNYPEIQSILKTLLEEHLKWRVGTPRTTAAPPIASWKSTSNGG